jgi:hypothetical protein
MRPASADELGAAALPEAIGRVDDAAARREPALGADRAGGVDGFGNRDARPEEVPRRPVCRAQLRLGGPRASVAAEALRGGAVDHTRDVLRGHANEERDLALVPHHAAHCAVESQMGVSENCAAHQGRHAAPHRAQRREGCQFFHLKAPRQSTRAPNALVVDLGGAGARR